MLDCDTSMENSPKRVMSVSLVIQEKWIQNLHDLDVTTQTALLSAGSPPPPPPVTGSLRLCCGVQRADTKVTTHCFLFKGCQIWLVGATLCLLESQANLALPTAGKALALSCQDHKQTYTSTYLQKEALTKVLTGWEGQLLRVRIR